MPMRDTLTITFFLNEGDTLEDGPRSLMLPAANLFVAPKQVHFDPDTEDLGVGFLLNNPSVVAVNAAWVDDYQDHREPVLTITGLFLANSDDPDSMETRISTDLEPNAVHVPYFRNGIQIAEWIVSYMQQNVYNQDEDEDNTA